MSRSCDCRSTTRVTTDSVSDVSDGRYHIRVSLYGLEVDALIDTGATLTYVDDSIRHYLDKLNVTPRSNKRIVQMADQTTASCLDTYPMRVSYRGTNTMVMASVIPTLAEPLILGMDFLHQRNLRISIDSKVIPVPTPKVERIHHLHTIAAREFLSDQENHQLENFLKRHEERSQEVNATHEFRLRHQTPIKQR